MNNVRLFIKKEKIYNTSKTQKAVDDRFTAFYSSFDSSTAILPIS